MSDRTIHATLADGGVVVRYDRAGKWYHEPLSSRRKAVSLKQAAMLAVKPDAKWHENLPGGRLFDAKVRALLAVRAR